MKKIMLVLVVMLTLCGCSSGDYERVGDVYAPEVLAGSGKMEVALPKEAAVFTSASDRRLYFCEGYEILMETFRSGNIGRTLRSITGFDTGALTAVETEQAGMHRTECTWTAATDGGDMVGRTIVLDDGQYHYCLTFTAEASEAGALQKTWQSIGSTFTVTE